MGRFCKMTNLSNQTLREFLEEKLKVKAFQIKPSPFFGTERSLKEDFVFNTEGFVPTKLIGDLIMEYHALHGVPFVKEISKNPIVEGQLYFNKPNSLVVVNPTFDIRRSTISVFEFEGIRY